MRIQIGYDRPIDGDPIWMAYSVQIVLTDVSRGVEISV